MLELGSCVDCVFLQEDCFAVITVRQRFLWGDLFRSLLKASWVLVHYYPLQTHTKTRGELYS